jgi:hypothetical protein
MTPTAREFLESKHIESSEPRCKAMIEFAKLHCIEQARIISEEACLTLESEISKDSACCLITTEIDKDSILNAYSLDLIK